MTALLTNPAEVKRKAEANTVVVRCWSPACGKNGQGKVLLRISSDKTTLFMVCPRCGVWQPVVIADIQVVE